MTVMYQPPAYVKAPDSETMASCWSLLREASARWNLPMAHITSHIRGNGAAEARRWLMGEMIRLGLNRGQIAWAFGLDRRRVRQSVIGGPLSPHGRPGGDRYRKVDLFGHPLPVVAVVVKKERPHYRERFMEALEVLRMVSKESEIAMRWVKRFES